MIHSRRSARALLATAFLLAAPATAQTFPTQPIRMVVGYGAGGGADSLIRAIAPELSEALGQPVIVDNRPGGGTVIGTQVVAASKPDGYTQIDIAHIPYKSTAAAILAVTSGEVPIAFGGVFACKGLIEGGRLRLLAIASATRNPALPSVPTFREAGWPAIDATGYRGLLAPAKTARAIVMRVNADANKVLQLPAVRARLAELSYDVVGGSPEDYGRIIAAEMEKWGKTIRSAGIKAQ